MSLNPNLLLTLSSNFIALFLIARSFSFDGDFREIFFLLFYERLSSQLSDIGDLLASGDSDGQVQRKETNWRMGNIYSYKVTVSDGK